MRPKAGAPRRFSGGGPATRARCVPSSRSAPASCASAGPLRPGRRAAWLRQRGGGPCSRRDRAEPPQARGPPPPAERPPRARASSVAGRGPTLAAGAPVGPRGRGGGGHGPWGRQDLAVAEPTGRWTPERLACSRLPCRRGGSAHSPPGAAWCVGGAPPRRDRLGEAHFRVPLAEGQAPGRGLLPRSPRVHQGGLPWAGPMGWLPAPRVGLRAPLSCCVWFVECAHGYLSV